MNGSALASLLGALAIAGTARAAQGAAHGSPLAPAGDLVEVPLESAASGAHEIRRPFRIRGDRRLAGARVLLDLDGPGERPASLEVLVNDGTVARLSGDALGGRTTIRVDPALLGDRNLLTMRVPAEDARSCRAARGAWQFLRSAVIEVTTVAAELPNDLALLPLPFLDAEVDQTATVPLVVGDALTLDRVRLATLAASWIGLLAGVPLRFAVESDRLPARSAVVLVDGAAAARALGVPPPDGRAIRVADHPQLGAAAKLVVIQGRNRDDLHAALLRLAQGRTFLAGEKVELPPPEREAPARPYDAPRWIAPGRPVRLGDLPGGDRLIIDGAHGARVSVRFRIAPDLWIWPDDFVPLDVRWSARLAGDAQLQEIDVELNGELLSRLPRPSVEDGVGTGRVRLRVPRVRLRGFNELAFHVRAPDSASACPDAHAAPAQIRISPDSVLHVEKGGLHALLPDLSTFLYDGFPMSRIADLGETVALLPDRPTPAEVASLLSIVAHLASVTGRAGTRLTVETPASMAAEALRGRDLLLVGSAGREPWGALSRARWPLDLGAERPLVRRPAGSSVALEVLSGAPGRLEIARARRVVSGIGRFAAVEEIGSPASRGRSAVLVTATSDADMPSMAELLGHADSTTAAGDLLVAADEGRWMFRVGQEFGTAELGAYTRVRWFVARHWLLLLPGLALGALLLALPVRRALAALQEARLDEDRA